MLLKTVLLALVAVSSANQSNQNSGYGYLRNYGIPAAKKILQYEKSLPKTSEDNEVLKKHPYHVGILIEINNLKDIAVCSGAIVKPTRVLTAGHCWVDGFNQAWRFTLVMGSSRLFSGGFRTNTSRVLKHDSWIPSGVLNDVAMAFLNEQVHYTATIAPVNLPSNSYHYWHPRQESFIGENAVVTGYNVIRGYDDINATNSLKSLVTIILDNRVCKSTFGELVRPMAHMCAESVDLIDHCDETTNDRTNGFSGGPLVITRNNQSTLIGVLSFSTSRYCNFRYPIVFTRFTHCMEFIKRYLHYRPYRR